MQNSEALPHSEFQKFANRLVNAEIGETVTDGFGFSVKKTDFATVEVSSELSGKRSTPISEYLKELQGDFDALSGDDAFNSCAD